jgi:hypothetical protein
MWWTAQCMRCTHVSNDLASGISLCELKIFYKKVTLKGKSIVYLNNLFIAWDCPGIAHLFHLFMKKNFIRPFYKPFLTTSTSAVAARTTHHEPSTGAGRLRRNCFSISRQRSGCLPALNAWWYCPMNCWTVLDCLSSRQHHGPYGIG